MNQFTLKRPVITEKSYRLVQDKVYTFEVDPKATKGQIKEAVEKAFAVTVLAVQTVKVAGKVRRTGRRRVESVAAGKKKAMVRIKKDQHIEVFELNVAQEN